MAKMKELSWSLSRARMFEECPRRFYYNFYLAPLGYLQDSPEEAKRAYEMKLIKSLDMWVGEVVHQTIQWMLEQARVGTITSADAARADVHQRLKDGWKGSKEELWRTHPPDIYPNLFEHYYDIEVGKSTKERLKIKAYVSVEKFRQIGAFERIANTPTDRWLPIDRFASFRLDGILMYVKFDFAIKDGKRIIIYDWKTGNISPDENRQLACYAMYTASKWNTPIENIAVCPAHLQPDFQYIEHSVSLEQLEEAKIYIKQSFNAMTKCLRNPVRNIAAIDDFPPTGNLCRCSRCSFKGICEQGKYASGDYDDLPVIQNEEL